MRDLTCANGRTHDCAQEDVDADGSIGQAVTVGCKLGAVVVGYCSHQAQVEATDEKPLSRQFDPGGGLSTVVKTKSDRDPSKRSRLANAIPDDCFEPTWTFAPMRILRLPIC